MTSKAQKEKEKEDQQAEKEANALVAFKEQAQLLPQDVNDDACCRRFLKARQFNVDKAVSMYNAYAKWRVDNEVDKVLDTPFSVSKELWKHSFHGRDRFGRPIFIEPTGILDIKTIVNKGYSMDTCVRAHIFQQEYLAKLTAEATKKEGRPIEQTLSILDLEGAGVWMHLNGTAREFFSILAGLAQNYYPERLYKLIVVNAPRAFPMAWSFIKPFLDINTQNKIIIPSYKDQYKVLQELVEPCFIPAKFGGECKCTEKGCLTNQNPTIVSDALRYNEGTIQPATETTKGASGGEKETTANEAVVNSSFTPEEEEEGKGKDGEEANKESEVQR